VTNVNHSTLLLFVNNKQTTFTGKSSIVRAISSGTPEVNNYPFTTRGMTLGHVQVFWESDDDVAKGHVAGVSIPSEKDLIREKLERRGVKSRRMEREDDTSTSLTSRKAFPISQLCQIMDSPGLLRREDGTKRNEMELLTLAAMSHLPTAVMFVMDLSGGAGDKCSSVEDQLILRREVRARFPRRPWIDVVSKVDLGIVDGAKERLMDILEEERLERSRQRGVEAGNKEKEEDENYFIELSIKEGMGVEELRQEVMRMLGEVRVVLDAMAAVDENSARA
jgi:nucleolar GTP-binding protein